MATLNAHNLQNAKWDTHNKRFMNYSQNPPRDNGAQVTTASAPPAASPAITRYAYPAAIANVVAQIGIIVTGGLVRLTGSGLGCSTWPMCEPSEFTPVFHSEMTYHPIIEFGNRTLTGVLSVIAVFLVLAVMLDKRATKRTKALAWWPLILIGVQAVVGGITVLVDLHPAIVAAHMLISVALVALSTVLAYRLSPKQRADVSVVPRKIKQTVLALGVWLIPIVCLGTITTGSGPHSGDTEVGYRFAIDPMNMARAHAAFVWIFIALLVVLFYLITVARRKSPESVPASLVTGYWWVVAITAVQGLIGYYQTFNGLPWVVVSLHLLGIGVFTLVTTRLVLLTLPAVAARN